jgi:hypothetical protein
VQQRDGPGSRERGDDDDEDDAHVPRGQPAHDVLERRPGPSTLALYPATVHVRPVAFGEWVRALSRSANSIGNGAKLDVERNPAVRLVDLYDGVARAGRDPRTFMSTRAQEASRTLREMDPINQDWIGNWMVQWGIRAVPN